MHNRLSWNQIKCGPVGQQPSQLQPFNDNVKLSYYAVAVQEQIKKENKPKNKKVTTYIL